MILRRVVEHVKAQNWTAIGIDLVIVVVGVFIGIQVANWNEALAARAQQEVYIERLHKDFEGIRARLSLHLEHYEHAAEGGDYVLALIGAGNAVPSDDPIDRDRLQRGLDALMSPRVPPQAPATYIEMVSEGQLSGVRPSELRDKLAEHDRLLGIVQEVSRIVIDRSRELTPVIYRYVVMRATLDDDTLSGIHLKLLSYDLAGMRSDREFAIVVTILREDALNSLGQRKFQLQMIDEILSMLEAEMK